MVIISEHKLGYVFEADLEKKEWLKEQLGAVRAKIKLLRYQLVKLTYPADAVQALGRTR